MKLRTRKFLALLGEDLTDEILELCRAASRSEQELVELTGAARPTVAAKAAILETRGLLERRTERTGATGRPPARWGARAADELDTFAKAADAFVLDLLEGQAAEYRAQMEDESGAWPDEAP